MSMPVDAAFFHANGYQVFEDVLPIDLIEELRGVLETDAYQSLTRVCKELDCEDATKLVDKIDAIARGADGSVDMLNKATRDALSGHISLQTRLSPSLRKIPANPDIQAIVRALLNSPRIFMHMPPTARFVLPGNASAGVPPHQDISYNKHMSHFVVLWVPLVDIDEDCGGVQVFHGSGFEEEQPVAQNPKDFWQSGVAASGFESVHCTLKRGDVLALNKWVIHASMPNHSKRIRFSIDHRFFGASDTSSKHFLDVQTGEIIAPA